MKYTDEQTTIINNKYENGDVVSIFAAAGAAKTTTMLALCKYWQDNNIYTNVLYLVYNTSMREEAEKKFKKEGITNVDIKTTHGLAYKYVGVHYKHKLQPNIRKTDIKNYFKCSWEASEKILNCLNEFFYSDSPHFNTTYGSFVTKQAGQWWVGMINRDNRTISMTHDGYLKLFSLQKDFDINYDVILIDEAQDSNVITLDIVLNKISSKNTIKIFTGDQYQQIYQFRGSTNIMNRLKCNKKLTLSKSFRFGANIAKLASNLTKHLGSSLDITGNDDVSDQVIKKDDLETKLSSYTWISRTNIGVIIKGFELMSQDINIHFLKGISSYVSDLWDVYYLSQYKHDQIKSKFYKSFRTYIDLKELANDSKDSEKKLLCKIVDQYSSDLPMYLNKLKTMSTSISKADIILTNVHTSKGLEFEHVMLDEDYMDLTSIREKNDFAELNLIYVASTRAKKKLILNKDLSKWYNDEHISSSKENNLSFMFS